MRVSAALEKRAALAVPKAASGPLAWLGTDYRRLGALWALLLLFPIVAPDSYIIGLGVFFLINLILIASLNLVMGFAGQISLAHGGFYGLGAYTSGILSAKLGLTPWLGLPAALATTGLLALLVGIPSLRLRGHYLAMATLGTNTILWVMFNELVSLTGGPNGLLGVESFSIAGFGIDDDMRFFYFAWIFAGLVMLVLLNLVNSRVGRGLRALSGSELAANSLGVDTFRYKLAVFVISAMMAGLAGSLYVHFIVFVSPETFGFITSVLLVVMVAIGGWGHYWGPIFGALVFTAAPELLQAFEDLELLLFGVCLIVVLLFFPRGIAGGLSALGKRLRRPGAEERA